MKLGKSNYPGPIMRVWTLDTVRQRCRVAGDCWIWTQGLNSAGYPQANIMGQPQMVGRWVLTEKSGVAFPPGFVTQQRCGNSSCVSPHCVWAKRRGVILTEQYRKKLRSKEKTVAQLEAARLTAVRQGWQKLTTQQVAEILATPFSAPRQDLARRFGVSVDTISRIRHGKQRGGPGASVFDLRWLARAA